MGKIGADLKAVLHRTQGRSMDDLCDQFNHQNVTNVNAATTLTPDECGTIVLGAAVGTEQAAGTGFNVYLPTPQRGLWYNFILRAPSIASNSNAAITVTATSDGSSAANIALGMVEGTGDDQGANVVAGVDVLTFVHAKATAGDHATFVCDGTNWFVTAKYDVDASITLA
jgi:hypothetical protein